MMTTKRHAWTQVVNAVLSAVLATSTAYAQSDATKPVHPGATRVAEKSALSFDTNEKEGITDKEIVIGSCNPQTGQLSERGLQLVIGANSAFKAVNDEGGINGRKIKLVVGDDKYDPEAAINCFNSCLKDKVFAGAFFVGSPCISKYARMGEADKIPLLAFCTGTPIVYEPSATRFVLRPGYQDEVARHIEELWKRGIRKIAVIYQSDAFGAAIRENAMRELANLKSAPIAEASYSRSSQEIDEAYDHVKRANPQVVLLGATTGAFKSLVQRKSQDKWNAQFFGFSVDTDFAGEMGKQSDGVVLTQVVPPLDDQLPLVQKYNKLRKKYYPNSSANSTALEAFQNALVIIEGLKRAGRDLTRTKFMSALESIHDFDMGAGPNFKVSFSQLNHKGLTPRAVYFVIMRDGKPVPLKPDDWQTLIKTAKST